MKQPRWTKEAFRGTEVHWSRSQTQIHKMLGELGIIQIRFTNVRDAFSMEFIVQLEEGQKPRAVRIVVPLKNTDDEKKREKELNIVHRILLSHLRNKFIAVAHGLNEFEQEFMAHLVITDKAGNSTTMGEALLPQYRQSVETGEASDFKLLGEQKRPDDES